MSCRTAERFPIRGNCLLNRSVSRARFPSSAAASGSIRLNPTESGSRTRARQINWAKGVQLLSKEFQKIVRRSELGRRNVDVLVQVWTVAGRGQWVLLHVEVQAQRDPEFPRRMFDYYSRICQRYNRPAASLAILADAHPGWKPALFQQALWGCESELRFPVCKLLDLARNETRLLQNPNPFAIVVLAQVKALQTQGALRQRRVWKATLAKLGHERGRGRQPGAASDVTEALHWLRSEPNRPVLLEVEIASSANVYPKMAFGRPITDMELLVQPTEMEGT